MMKITNTALLLLAVILLIVGFPFVVFGLFLAVSQANGLEANVASRFGFGGLVSVSCALVLKAYLRRRDGWF